MDHGLAPIALFAYKRPEHLHRTLQALAANAEAAGSRLVVFCDGARHEADRAAVEAVRGLVAGIRGFAAVRVVASPTNLGLARSVTRGVSELLQQHDRLVVLEDDLVVGPHFLRYMNDALRCYADDERVASIHGYLYPVGERLPETFFLRGADCWGWGTWRRAWARFEPDARKLLAELRRRGLTRAFDLDGSYPYTRMLEDCIEGRNDSWAIRWHACAFLDGALTLYPGSSQVQNIGADGSGVHVGDTRTFEHAEWGREIQVGGIAVTESAAARRCFAAYLAALRPSFAHRVLRRLRRLVPSRAAT
ncbi:MAG TPA: glycosyltransferase [Burkholderiales bacterium]|nr:glycosyltransferase [Burkholderiales bacterium]